MFVRMEEGGNGGFLVIENVGIAIWSGCFRMFYVRKEGIHWTAACRMHVVKVYIIPALFLQSLNCGVCKVIFYSAHLC